MRGVARKWSIALTGEELFSSLSVALVIWVLEIFTEISFAALVFSGELGAFQSRGIGILLFGALIFIVVGVFTSSFRSTIMLPQDSALAIVASIAATIGATMPTAAPERMYATVVVTMMLSALLAGLLFFLMGHWRLGRVVRFIPYPVVGGFLGGMGWLLVVGGVAVMTDVPAGPALLQPLVLLRWGPGVLFAIALLWLSRRYAHFLLLPGLLLIGVGIFYLAYLALAGVMPSGGAEGWLLGPFPDGRIWQPNTITMVAHADWAVVAQNTVSISVILLISAVSLLLNLSGIEIATHSDIDLNRELRAAGLANLLASTGGTSVGFHALSFSALGHQLGIRSRMIGIWVALLLGFTLFLSVDLLTLFPKMIAGGFLVYLGFTFLVEWVYEAWNKLPRLDYLLIWLILITIAAAGFLEGVAVGILVAVARFAVDYSRIHAVRHVLTGAQLRSHMVRPRLYEQLLQRRGEQIYILVLQGVLFFGSAHRLIEQIRERIECADRPTPRFIVLDFRLVMGVDASAQFAFVRMAQLAQSRSILLVATALPETLRTWWQHQMTDSDSDLSVYDDRAPESPLEKTQPIFSDLDTGLAWCEEKIIGAFTDVGLSAEPKTFSQLVAEQLPNSVPTDWLEHLHPGAKPAQPPEIARLESALQRQQVRAGEIILSSRLDGGVHLLEWGQAVVQCKTQHETKILRVIEAGAFIDHTDLYASHGDSKNGDSRNGDSKNGYSSNSDSPAGAIHIVASQPSCVLHLSAADLQAIESDTPELAIAIYRVLSTMLGDRLAHTVRLAEALQK